MKKVHSRWQKFICRKNVCQVMGDDHDDIAKLGIIFKKVVDCLHTYRLVCDVEMT